MLGVIWDGALRGVHRNALAKAGLLAINKQHGKPPPENSQKFAAKPATTTCTRSPAASPNAP